MGYLNYGSTVYEFDDRTLAHLRIAITTKLRYQEGFLLTWDSEAPTGRVSIWLSREIPLAFEFDSPSPVPIDRDWIDTLLVKSRRTADMTLNRRQLTV